VSAPRIVVVTDAGGEAGLGHLKRCAALAQALGARGFVVHALVAGPPDAGLATVAPDLAVTPLAWWGTPRRVLDVAGAPEAFVVDSYHTDEALLGALRWGLALFGLLLAIAPFIWCCCKACQCKDAQHTPGLPVGDYYPAAFAVDPSERAAP